MKNTLLKLLVLTTAIMPLAGCDDPSDDKKYKDSDFDGLYDSIDPLKNDNEFTYYHQEPDSEEKSNEISTHVDFRNFLKDGYNKELSQISGLLQCFGYPENGVIWHINKNHYENDESKVNPCLVNLGFENIKEITDLGTFEYDQYDICGTYLGEHVFINDDGKKYQVIAVNVIGYPDNKVWFSNFDFGADTPGYFEIDGSHPEWTNKKHHKGFDVTANRLYEQVKKYISDVKKDNVDQIIWPVGHSRAGSIANLLGKKLVDDSYRTLCYTFNCPNTTTEDDETILGKYVKNIFNVRSKNDFLSAYPYDYFGFKTYGHRFEYDFFDTNVNAEYKRIFKKDFVGNTQEDVESIKDCIHDLAENRNDNYEYDEDRVRTIELEAQTLEEAKEEVETYEEDIELANLKNITKTRIIENPDYVDEDDAKFLYEFNSKAIVMYRVLAHCLVKGFTGESPLVEVILQLFSSLLFIKDDALSLLFKLVLSGIELNPDKFATPHKQAPTTLGCAFAKEVIE